MLVIAFGAVAAVGGAFCLGYGYGRIDGRTSARREYMDKSSVPKVPETETSRLKNAMKIRPARSTRPQ